MVRVGIGLPDISVIPWRLYLRMAHIPSQCDVKGPLILDVWSVALGVWASVTKDVHVPLSLRHNLPIGIPDGLVPLKTPDKLPEAVAMPRELCTEGCHRGFGL